MSESAEHRPIKVYQCRTTFARMFRRENQAMIQAFGRDDFHSGDRVAENSVGIQPIETYMGISGIPSGENLTHTLVALFTKAS